MNDNDPAAGQGSPSEQDLGWEEWTGPVERAEMSTNELAEQTVGRRPEGVFAADQPVELGYWCPVCKIEPVGDDGEYDERLHWSEYNGFIWCEVCNVDYPSALCVRLHATPVEAQPWLVVGVEAAIDTYLQTIAAAQARCAADEAPVLTDDEVWDRAEALVAELAESGELCGHPSDEDVAATIRMLHRAGKLVLR